MNSKTIFSTIFIALFSLFGCSSSNPKILDMEFSASPVTPDTMLASPLDGSPGDGYGIIGKYLAHIDIPSLQGELTPVRQSSSEDVLEIVDISNFLQLVPCNDCVDLGSIELDSSGNLILSIGIRHPFKAPNLQLPPTAQNRADLHVFNVEGTVVIEGAVVDTTTFPLLGETVAPLVLINADGYSSYLDASLDSFLATTATVHPYILHFDDFSQGNFSASNQLGFSDITNPTGNLVMKQGSGMDYKDYVFDLNIISDSLNFIFAVGCTYGVSANNKDQRLTPVYRLPQFNKKAATKAYISQIIENPPNGFRDGIILSSETLKISVLDMNYNTAVGSALDKVKFASGIAKIEVEIPGIILNLINLPAPVPTGGNPRNPLNPLTFEITVTNELGASEGIYTGLVKITDSYPPSANVVVLGDGIARVDPTQSPLDGLFSMPEYAAYASFQVVVAMSNIPPTACYTTFPAFDPLVVFEQLPVQFDPACSTDTDSDIELWEWDFDYDEITFNVDDWNITGEPVSHS
ncbi:PKD domain-containing protein, partial [bacterium]|nr:PKD domain-containing protein [bacterium]MBU1025625.1 PKD domain-containing protein [bacterium]